MGLALSKELLTKLWPKAPAALIAGVSGASAEAFSHYKMTTVAEIVDFMAECSEETGGGMALVESGAYSAERAHEVWPGLFPTVQSAQVVVGNPKALFDRTYGGRLGNIAGTDDGYNFRGRGLIQITGRSWYAEIAKETGLDLLDYPDRASDPEHALECALAFWKLDNVNSLVGNFRAEVKRINGGYTNMAAREAWERECQKLLTATSLAFSPVVAAAPIPAPPLPPGILRPGMSPDAHATEAVVHPTLTAEIHALLVKWFGSR